MSRSVEGLRSVIGFWGGTAIVIGCTVGSGIFRAPGEIAQVLPNPPLILALWLLLGLVSLCGALTLAELVSLFPHTGGTYLYLRAAYGDAAAFAFGWLYLIAAIPSGIGTLAMVFSERVMELLYGGAENVSGLLVRAIAAGTIVLLSAANIIGVRFGASIQGLFTAIKVAALLGLLVATATIGQVHTGNLSPLATPNLGSLAQAAAFVIFTYNGWVYISLVAGELSDARRQIKRTILVSMAVIIGLYLAANLAYHLSLPVGQVSGEQVVARRLANDWLGPWGGAAMSACILASVFGTLNGVILTNARVPFALARSGLGFRALGRVHPRFSTPHVAIGVQAAVAIALVFWLESFARLSTYFVLVEWSALVFAIAAIFVLRPRAPTSAGYHTPGYPVVPLVFVLGAGSILIGIAASTWTAGDRAPVLGLLIAAAGLPLYHLWRRFVRKAVVWALILGAGTLPGRGFAQDSPRLRVSLGHAPSHFLPGMTATYVTVTVRNPGGASISGPVTVTATLPAGLKPSAAAGVGWACTVAASPTCTRTDRLGPRAAYPLIRIVVDVAGDLPAQLTTSATVSWGSASDSATDIIPARDACPYGWSPDQTVSFAPPFRPGRPGGIDSGVRNPEQADGCTLLDAIWGAEPFDSHERFVDTVKRTTEDFVSNGLLTRSQQRAVDAAARRSEVGSGEDRQVDNSCAKRIALKFDDGPSSFRPQLLQVLRDQQVHATFFDNGVRVKANPQVARFQVREGHIQLSHTFLHVHLDHLPAGAIRDETLSTEAALRSAGAPMTFKGIRPPFGGTNATVSRVLLEMGYTEFRSGAQVGAQDWLPERTAAAIRDDIVRQLRPGLIIGLHDGAIDTPAGAATVEAVRQAIDRARELGYCFGVVDDSAQVVADRYASSGQPIPLTTNPVPYRLPLTSGSPDQLPRPFVRIPSPLQITARHAPATLVRGQAGTLTLTITNRSRKPTDGAPVNVADKIPAGLIATAASGNGWTCTGTETRQCTRSDVLAPNASYPPIIIQVKVADDAPASIVNTPSLTAHGTAWTDEDSDPIRIAVQS